VNEGYSRTSSPGRPIGSSINAAEWADFAVARYTADGALDPSFGSDGTVTVDFFGASDSAQCVAIQADGKILVAGSARNAVASVLALVRILP
jgi:uncharacterized delta-60 repeat protein